MKTVRAWWRNRLFKWACGVVTKEGRTVVEIRSVAGTDYLVNQQDGSLIRIGGKVRK